MNDTAGAVKEAAMNVEVVGIVVSLLHDSYQIILPESSASILVTVDLVAKSVQYDRRGPPFLVPVQCSDDTRSPKKPKV